MYFDDFLDRLKKDDLAHLILLFGDEENVISEGTKVIKEKFKKSHSDGSLQVFDAVEQSLEAIISTAQTSGLFATTQLLIVQNAQKILGGHSEGALEQLKEYYKNPNPDSYLIFQAVGMRKTGKAVTMIERWGWTVQCSQMPEWKLVSWVKKQAQARGLFISEDAIEWFIQKVGNDMAYLQRGLDQLVDYVYPEKKVSVQQVKELAVPGVESEIFSFLDAVAFRQTERALKLLGQLQGGVDTGTTMMLYGRMRELLSVAVGKAAGFNPSQAAEEFGLHPFRLKNLWEQSSQFTVNELQGALKDIIHLQAGVVTGRLGKQVPVWVMERWLLKWGKTKTALR